MSHEEMEEISKFIDWFSSPYSTYFKEFGSSKSSHMLPSYATDKLVMQEVAYHLSTGLSGML